ncbi:hypothetical protein DUI87_13807 [Hirundo rustica rustica]|uniref:Uncharacterized protein n=1 Tax=Hirundo rustica rustica TaxID=333673 RepID=A0A3M0K8G5_HIRRU|nr:hypothetical protein DUI87_13807 [Hirundo rustica rustica]
MGAQPDAGEPSQEQLAQQQASGSQQLSFHSSQDAVLAVPAVPAGNSLSLVVEISLRHQGGSSTSRKLPHNSPGLPPRPLEEQGKRRSCRTCTSGAGSWERRLGTVFSGIRLSETGATVAIKHVARESVLQWVSW